MDQKIRVTAVSYLNTKPLLYGLVHHPIAEQIELSLNIPSVCAQKLRDDEVDLALMPVAGIPDLDSAQIVSDYCIGTVGAVQTVCIYSEQPIEHIKRIYLDYHSRTSVALTRLLAKEYWQIEPVFLNAEPGYIDEIKGDTAGLVIGDRTIGLDKRFPYVYDLGEIWMKHTTLPFVFAAWVANKPLPSAFLTAFNEALAQGLDHIPQLIYLLPNSMENPFDLEAYFTKHISYELDSAKKQALRRFLDTITEKSKPAYRFSVVQ